MAILTACETKSTSNIESDTMYPPVPAYAEKIAYDDGSGLVHVTIYAPDGTIMEQGDYLNNFREGVYTEYHKNGFLKTSCGYIKGRKEGQMITMNDRGQIEERATYHQDVLHGAFVIYKASRVKEKRYYYEGELEGEQQKFYPNGVLMEASNYKKGKRDGTSHWYDQEGKETITYTYKDGELVDKGDK